MNVKYFLLFVFCIVSSCLHNEETDFYKLINIEETFIHHTSECPLGYFRDENLIVVNSREEYLQLIKSWNIEELPFTYNPETSTLIAVQRMLDYNILSQNVEFLSSQSQYICRINYHLTASSCKENVYYELVLCLVPKINKDIPVFFHSGVYG